MLNFLYQIIKANLSVQQFIFHIFIIIIKVYNYLLNFKLKDYYYLDHFKISQFMINFKFFIIIIIK